MAKYLLPEAMEDAAATFSHHAAICERYNADDYPSETWERICQLQHDAAKQYRELSRLHHAIAAQMGKLVDECEEMGLECPLLTEEQANEQASDHDND